MMRWATPHALALVLIGIITLPFLLRQNAWGEWANSYYFFVTQRRAIAESGLPTYFVASASAGVFYPQHVFYGGFAFSAAAYVTYPLPSFAAFGLTVVAAYAALYFGAFQLLRTCRLNKLISAALAITFALSPYTVTLLYGRGAWSELVGLSSGVLTIGLVTKSAFDLERISTSAFLGMTASIAISTSAHNISLLLFVIVLVPLVVTYLVVVHRNRINRRNLRPILLSSVSGTLIPSVFMFPNLFYATLTDVSKWRIADTASALSSLGNILSPVLYFPRSQQKIHLAIFGSEVEVRLFNQTLVAILFLVTICAIKYVVNAPSPFFRCWRVALAALLPWTILFLETSSFLWRRIGFPFSMVQFAYRLSPYLALSIILSSAMMIKIAEGQQLFTKILRVLLTVAIFWYVLLACVQSLTATPTSPPSFATPEVSAITRGVPPPLFNGLSAAPIQFRMTNLGAEAQTPERKLLISEKGVVPASVRLRVETLFSELGEGTTPLLQTGTTGNATTLGVTRHLDRVRFMADPWGQAPITSHWATLTAHSQGNIDIQIDWSTYRISISDDSSGIGLDAPLITDQPGVYVLGKDLAGSSLVDQRSEERIQEVSQRYIAPTLMPGRYLTNVVWSPFTTWTNSRSSLRSETGYWIVEPIDATVRVVVRDSLVLRVGKISTGLGLIALIVGLASSMSAFVRHKKQRFQRVERI